MESNFSIPLRQCPGSEGVIPRSIQHCKGNVSVLSDCIIYASVQGYSDSQNIMSKIIYPGNCAGKLFSCGFTQFYGMTEACSTVTLEVSVAVISNVTISTAATGGLKFN